MIVGTPECYEPSEAMSVLREWYAEKQQEIHVVGPLTSSSKYALDSERRHSTNPAEFQRFLDRAMDMYGAKSLVYVGVARSFIL